MCATNEFNLFIVSGEQDDPAGLIRPNQRKPVLALLNRSAALQSELYLHSAYDRAAQRVAQHNSQHFADAE